MEHALQNPLQQLTIWEDKSFFAVRAYGLAAIQHPSLHLSNEAAILKLIDDQLVAVRINNRNFPNTRHGSALLCGRFGRRTSLRNGGVCKASLRFDAAFLRDRGYAASLRKLGPLCLRALETANVPPRHAPSSLIGQYDRAFPVRRRSTVRTPGAEPERRRGR